MNLLKEQQKDMCCCKSPQHQGVGDVPPPAWSAKLKVIQFKNEQDRQLL